MRLLLRYFNSGRIPFGFPDSSCVLALICMGGVLMLLKVILGAREREMAGSVPPLAPACTTGLGRSPTSDSLRPAATPHLSRSILVQSEFLSAAGSTRPWAVDRLPALSVAAPTVVVGLLDDAATAAAPR